MSDPADAIADHILRTGRVREAQRLHPGVPWGQALFARIAEAVAEREARTRADDEPIVGDVAFWCEVQS